ncbi:ATP-binding response regulator [Anthocerotibacter panamensis]|uniref:ATP-binding response regulator n=1 Tax=Anthocerotibacter panamensis TaxID=2857077 RepID=UPI001C40274F|nr:ATP-binding protein [Anthocerotibacter panamensis]
MSPPLHSPESILLTLQTYLGRATLPQEIAQYAVRCIGELLKAWRCVLVQPNIITGQPVVMAEFCPDLQDLAAKDCLTRHGAEEDDLLLFENIAASTVTPEPNSQTACAKDRRELWDLPGYQIPLVHQGVTYGLLELYPSWLSERCTTTHATLLEMMAQQVSSALCIAAAQAQQRVLEQKIQDLETANARQMEFLADVSHDLRTPLSTVIGMAKVLLQGTYGSTNAKQNEYLTSICESSQHSLNLISNILDLSKINAERVELNIEYVDVQQVCTQCLTLVDAQVQAQNLTARLFIDPRLQYIPVDELRLKQMLLNLLSNAIKFTPPQGFVGLTVQPALSAGGTPCVHLTVWDTGVGIAQDKQKLLFQPFNQVTSSLALRNQGTGLGLSITWKLAELHGGRVLVDSAPNDGARFTLELPLFTVATAQTHAISTPQRITAGEHAVFNRGRILLVEDHPISAQLLTDYLRHLGYQITWVANGRDFQAQILAVPVHLVLMDVQLPDQDGPTLVKWLRGQQNVAHLPVIALTALALEEDRQRCLEAGANRYLTKPIDFPLLASVLDLYCPQQG